MKILLIGATGQLGQDIQLALREAGGKDELLPVTHTELDIRERERVFEMVRRAEPDCVINTAAFHRVDLCEDEPENAFAVNEGGVRNLAEAAKEASALLVQFSTDYVFDGAKRRPYLESDQPNPQSVYAKSRLAGERAVEQTGGAYLLIRTCGLYGFAGSQSKAGNFVETILKLAAQKKPLRVVDDQVCTPTSTRRLARRLLPLIRSGARGLFHMTNSGECSWYEFAREIFRLSKVEADLRPCTTAQFAAKAPRPAYSVLEHRALRAAGFEDFRPWQEALAEYLELRKQHSPKSP
jgi:dTDP-4-dehydrorhamnose reductase